MAFLHLLVLGCMLGLTLSQADHPDCKNLLPDKTGFLPHPDKSECRKYISCYKGFRGEAECPVGTYHKKCKPFDECLSEAEIDALAKTDPTCKCQFCKGDETSLYPKENSEFCDEFIMCAKGVQITMRCPEGQSYDKVKKTCLNAAVVDCDINTCAKTWDATKESLQAARAPDLKNCNVYSVCVKGEKVLSQSCGEGFMYDVNQEEEFNGVQIMGKCIPKPKEKLSLYAACPDCCEDTATNPDCCLAKCDECVGCDATTPVVGDTCLAKCPQLATTIAPVTTAAPAETTAAPAETTADPAETTDAPPPATTQPPQPSTPQCFTGRNWVSPTIA